ECDLVFSLAINHAGLSCHRAPIENSRPRKFAGAPAVCPGGEPCQSSRCHHSRRNFASTICGRGFSDRSRRHIFYETRFVNFRDRIHERIADLAKKLRRAFAGRFARTVTERQLSLHFISGRNAHSHRRDGEFQTRAGTVVAGTSVPIVPCYLNGTFAALPASATVPRWKRISVTIGKPLSFSATTSDRTGWELIAAATGNAVRALATLP